MTKVVFTVDYDCGMLSIKKGGSTLFYGNFWDFNCPGDIITLLDSLGIKTEVVEKLYDSWED